VFEDMSTGAMVLCLWPTSPISHPFSLGYIYVLKQCRLLPAIPLRRKGRHGRTGFLRGLLLLFVPVETGGMTHLSPSLSASTFSMPLCSVTGGESAIGGLKEIHHHLPSTGRRGHYHTTSSDLGAVVLLPSCPPRCPLGGWRTWVFLFCAASRHTARRAPRAPVRRHRGPCHHGCHRLPPLRAPLYTCTSAPHAPPKHILRHNNHFT